LIPYRNPFIEKLVIFREMFITCFGSVRTVNRQRCGAVDCRLSVLNLLV